MPRLCQGSPTEGRACSGLCQQTDGCIAMARSLSAHTCARAGSVNLQTRLCLCDHADRREVVYRGARAAICMASQAHASAEPKLAPARGDRRRLRGPHARGRCARKKALVFAPPRTCRPGAADDEMLGACLTLWRRQSVGVPFFRAASRVQHCALMKARQRECSSRSKHLSDFACDFCYVFDMRFGVVKEAEGVVNAMVRKMSASLQNHPLPPPLLRCA